MGKISKFTIFIAMVLLTIVSMWTTYISLATSIFPEPTVPIPLGHGKNWDCSVFALGLSVAIGLMLFSMKLAIIDEHKKLSFSGIIGLTIIAFISISFNMDVLYRISEKDFFIRFSSDKVKSTYDTYLAKVKQELETKREKIKKELARQQGELESEIKGLRQAPQGYGPRAKKEDYRLTVMKKEAQVELDTIDKALKAQQKADALLAGTQPTSLDEVQTLQDQLRVAVKNAGALAGIPLPAPVSLQNPLFAVFEHLFDFRKIGIKEIFFLILAFLIDLGDIIGYSLVPTNKEKEQAAKATASSSDLDPDRGFVPELLPSPNFPFDSDNEASSNTEHPMEFPGGEDIPHTEKEEKPSFSRRPSIRFRR